MNALLQRWTTQDWKTPKGVFFVTSQGGRARALPTHTGAGTGGLRAAAAAWYFLTMWATAGGRAGGGEGELGKLLEKNFNSRWNKKFWKNWWLKFSQTDHAAPDTDNK